jgi:predicted ArsR family transcriptional regulator
LTQRQNTSQNLGRTQKLVLHLLASTGEASAWDLAYHWPGLTESAAGSAVNRLAGRGLVDLGRGDWSRGRFSRTFVLTSEGRSVESSLLGDWEAEEE